ncbi:MAG: hypothetical protein R2941_22445, partial [Desulfobacterales bacterium]
GDKYIESVKEGFLDAHPTNSIGKSLSPPMFDNILWESQQAADGTWLVRFTGTVTKALNEKALQKLVFMSNHPRYTAIANHIIHNTKIFVPGEKAELIFTFTGEGRFTITRQYVPSCYNAGVKKSFMDDLITGIIFSPV